MDVNVREAGAVAAVAAVAPPRGAAQPPAQERRTAQQQAVNTTQQTTQAQPARAQQNAQTAQTTQTAQTIEAVQNNQQAQQPQNNTYQTEAIPEIAITAVENAVAQANEQMLGIGRHLEYSIHEPTNTILVRVVDTDTNETVREIPPESRLDTIYRLREASGINIDDFV